MNKKLGLVILILVFGVGAYFLLSKSKTQTPVTDNSVSSGASSIKDLLSSGIPQKCTYSSTADSGTTEGTSYVSAGKVRADFTNTTSDKTTISHMITDGKTNYIWTEGEKNGFKTTVQDTQTSQPESSPSGNSVQTEETNLNQKVDYKCSAWVPDESLFTPPSDITFTDFSQMVNSSPVAAPQGNSSQCSYCDSLSGDSKTQCLSSLNCQ